MPEVNLESRTAAKGLARLFFIAIVIGLVTGTATWLFIAADDYGTEFLWEELRSS